MAAGIQRCAPRQIKRCAPRTVKRCGFASGMAVSVDAQLRHGWHGLFEGCGITLSEWPGSPTFLTTMGFFPRFYLRSVRFAGLPPFGNAPSHADTECGLQLPKNVGDGGGIDCMRFGFQTYLLPDAIVPITSLVGVAEFEVWLEKDVRPENWQDFAAMYANACCIDQGTCEQPQILHNPFSPDTYGWSAAVVADSPADRFQLMGNLRVKAYLPDVVSSSQVPPVVTIDWFDSYVTHVSYERSTDTIIRDGSLPMSNQRFFGCSPFSVETGSQHTTYLGAYSDFCVRDTSRRWTLDFSNPASQTAGYELRSPESSILCMQHAGYPGDVDLSEWNKTWPIDGPVREAAVIFFGTT